MWVSKQKRKHTISASFFVIGCLELDKYISSSSIIFLFQSCQRERRVRARKNILEFSLFLSRFLHILHLARACVKAKIIVIVIETSGLFGTLSLCYCFSRYSSAPEKTFSFTWHYYMGARALYIQAKQSKPNFVLAFSLPLYTRCTLRSLFSLLFLDFID